MTIFIGFIIFAVAVIMLVGASAPSNPYAQLQPPIRSELIAKCKKRGYTEEKIGWVIEDEEEWYGEELKG
jgi:hypothetical protein